MKEFQQVENKMFWVVGYIKEMQKRVSDKFLLTLKLYILINLVHVGDPHEGPGEMIAYLLNAYF